MTGNFDKDAPPDVSVILPVHNAEQYLRACLVQIANLTGRQSLEVVVVDDGSNVPVDDALISSLIQVPYVLIRNEQCTGVAAARNRALTASRGLFVWFVDVDDNWKSNIVSRLFEEATRARADIVVCGAQKQRRGITHSAMISRFQDFLLLDRKDAAALFISERLTGHLWNKLFRAEPIRHISVFPSGQRAYSDMTGFVRALLVANIIAVVPEIMYLYKDNGGSIVNSGYLSFDDIYACLVDIENLVDEAGLSGTIDAERFRARMIYYNAMNSLAKTQKFSPDPNRRRKVQRDLRAVSLEAILDRSRPAASMALLVCRMSYWLYAALLTTLNTARHYRRALRLSRRCSAVRKRGT